MTAAGQHAVIIPPRLGTAPREILHRSQAAAGPRCSLTCACLHTSAPPPRLEGDGSDDGGRSLWTVGALPLGHERRRSVHKDFGRVIMSLLWICGSAGREENER